MVTRDEEQEWNRSVLDGEQQENSSLYLGGCGLVAQAYHASPSAGSPLEASSSHSLPWREFA